VVRGLYVAVLLAKALLMVVLKYVCVMDPSAGKRLFSWKILKTIMRQIRLVEDNSLSGELTSFFAGTCSHLATLSPISSVVCGMLLTELEIMLLTLLLQVVLPGYTHCCRQHMYLC